MRAVRCRNDGVALVEVPEPTGEGIDVRVCSAGICGSDLHLVSGPFKPTGTLGHELAGTLADGTPVAIEPLAPCGECGPCREGMYNLCVVGPAMLFGLGRDGGMADRIRVPPAAIVPLPRGVRVEDACLVEPLAVTVHGIRRAGLSAGERVVVIGGGTIGLCSVAAARSAGASVDLLARHDHQRAAGARLGAGEPSGSYDVVIDAAGTTSALEKAVELGAPGARLLCVATYWEGMTLPGMFLCLKEISVVPASLYCRAGPSRDVDVAATLLAENPEIARAIVTHRFPLDAAVEAFRVAGDRRSGAIKVVLEP